MKEIQKALNSFEEQLIKIHGLCLNEAMALCSLSDEKLSASDISEKTGLTNSHTSKIIKSIEEKRLIKRVLGEKDKRQMYFSITKQGKEKLALLKSQELQIPSIFEPIFNKCNQLYE
jgi:DNA-binding MarR family transcriptional regulator